VVLKTDIIMSETSDEIKNQVAEFIQELEDNAGSDESRYILNEYMEEMSALGVERYSANNQFILWRQIKNRDLELGKAKHFHGYHTWRNMYGRQVIKGESGFQVLSPIITSKCPECGNSVSYHDKDFVDCTEHEKSNTDNWSKGVVGYSTKTVFEYNQTVSIEKAEGISLDDVDTDEVWEPTDRTATGDGSEVVTALRSIIQDKGIELGIEEMMGNVRGASYDGKITLAENLDDATEFQTLTHELAHELLHWDDDYPSEQKEVEAEAVAFAVCGRYGIDTESMMYVTHWDSDDVDTWSRIEDINKTATKIISDIDEKITD